jgi:ribosomal protein S14
VFTTSTMASPLVSKAPQCLSCIRQRATFSSAFALSRQQVRGKKKVAKVTTIPVQLRVNVAGYGKKGISSVLISIDVLTNFKVQLSLYLEE